MRKLRFVLPGLFLASVLLVVSAQGQTSMFTFQGRLIDSALAANGTYEMQFAMYDAAASGTQIGSTVTNPAVVVTYGVFSVQLSFSPATPFASGADRWIEVSVRKAADPPGYTILSPRQQVTSAPFAMRAQNAGSADGLSAACNLCITDAQISGIDGAKVTGTVANATNAATATAATTAGNVTGVVAIANGGTGSSTQNFVDLTTNQTVGGAKTFTNPPVGDGSQLTNINGANITNNSINASALAFGATSRIDLPLLAALRWDLLASPKTFVVGTQPESVAFDGVNIWVANFLSNNVTKLRASDGVLQGTFVFGSNPWAVAFDGANIWVANDGSNNVTKLRASDGALQGTFAVGFHPRGVAFDGANIWVTNSSGANVTKLRASDGALQGTFAVGTTPYGVAFDGANIWVANYGSNNVTKLRASDGVLQGTFAVNTSPSGVAFDGSNMWVTNVASNNVTKLRASDGALQGTFAVGTTPYGVAFDGSNMWVTNFGSNNVTKLRASDGALQGTFAVGTNPVGVVFDGANIWVGNFGSNNATKMPVFP
ncbi:hypothetical protein BH10ACI3_BH10ACI3_26500 [soil metagenome]